MTKEPNAAPDRYLFGPYEIIDTLGKGGMGVVYRAQDRTLVREVALKILRDDLRGEERVLARFRREAEAFARLDHPNIVHVFSVGAVENIPFIAMQYIEGETLADRLRRTGPMPWQDALKIGKEVAEALACAHAAQVVHRDIKPGNILLGEDGRVLVTDFGIAKVLNATTQLTLDGSRLGTPQYMCPERCRNKPVTPSSDLYSLGVVLFQSITGKLPYAARSNVELIDRITGEDALRATSLVPELPEPVDRLLAWLLEKNPARRPASAAVLAELIARVLEGKPLDAEADERDRALDGYRRDLPGKAMRAPRKEARKEALPRPARKQFDISRRWFAMPAWMRAGSVVLLSAILITTAGMTVYPLLARPLVRVEQLSGPEALARWDAPAALMTFTNEGTGVRIGSLNLPGIPVAQLISTAPAGIMLLSLRGEADTQGKQTHAVLSLDGATGETRSLLPPTPTNDAFLPLALTTGATPGASSQLLYSTGQVTRSWNVEEIAALSASLPGETIHLGAAQAATLPYLRDGVQEFALAATRGGFHDWALTAQGGTTRGDDAQLVAPGAPIVAAAASTDGQWLAFLRQPANESRELWLSPRGGASRLLAEGDLALTQRALEPAGARIVYARNGGVSEVVLLDTAASGADVTWPGYQPQWLPAGGMILYITEDALQRSQIFAVDPANPLHPRQLTHLETGIGSSFALDTSGRWALAPLPDAAKVILLDLTVLLAN